MLVLVSKMKNNKVLYIIIAICILLVIGICIFLALNHKEENLNDAQRFKKEFEQYNESIYEDVNEEVIDVEISEDNPIVYKTGKEIVEIMDTENAYIFFGYATCPYTRNAVETLISVAKEENIDTIYYVDIQNIRDEYMFNGSIVPELTKNGTDAYYEIVDLLKNRLSEYFVTDSSGNRYDTGVKRLNSPTFIAIKDREILGFHEGLVTSVNDIYKKIDDDQKAELKNYYLEIINSIK